MKKTKVIKFLILLLLCALYVLLKIITQKYIIRFIIPSFFLCAAIILGVSFIIDSIRIFQDKFKIKLFLFVMSIIFCLFILVTEMYIVSPKKYYNIHVKDLSENYDIVLCEYLHLRSLEGMLCIKINDLVYLKLKDTSYCVEPNHSLSDPKNMSINYDKKTGELTMRYTWTEGSEYYENKTTYFVD